MANLNPHHHRCPAPNTSAPFNLRQRKQGDRSPTPTVQVAKIANRIFQHPGTRKRTTAANLRLLTTAVIAIICIICAVTKVGVLMLYFASSRDSSFFRGGATTVTTSTGTTSSSIFHCTTDECQRRLGELQSKIALEEKLYKQIYDKERRRTELAQSPEGKKEAKVTRHEIVRQRTRQIQANRRVAVHPPPPAEWLHKSYPEINIVGNLKTGTSQLYNIINTHRDVKRIVDDEKEHCFTDDISSNDDGYDDDGPQRSTQAYGLHTWHSYYYDFYDEQDHRPRVNGCVAWDEVETQIVYVPPSPDAKFFVILRDPADWMWAAYNFWCDTAWEDWEGDDNWVKDNKVHYRSPEVFHEVVLSGGQLKAYDGLIELRDNSVTILRRMQALVGKDNLIVLRNEDLVPGRVDAPGGVLDTISKSTGLAKDGFDGAVLHSRSNCNAHKGYGTIKACTEKSHQGGGGRGYPVTHDRPMLEATRKFIYLQWHTECKVWAEEFGIFYPECLDVIRTKR